MDSEVYGGRRARFIDRLEEIPSAIVLEKRVKKRKKCFFPAASQEDVFTPRLLDDTVA